MFIRPNWKDVKAYRESESMSLGGGIAWEFLRRNPEYQKEMAMYQLELISVFEKTKKVVTLTVFVNFKTLSIIINRPSSINSWLIARWSYQLLVDK